ncbi:MAG: hypothetical protein Q4C08_04590, partial [Pseudomonadota bacterium]|nr:hypothetical protein [Pseudomonadota bacterium]
RALQDPTGEDAKAWAAQKDDSAKKMKTGLTVAGIGAIGGAVGNLLINKDSEKENSKEILDKYKDGDLTGKVSKSPDGKLVAEPVNQETLMNQSTVNSEAITDPKSDQMIVVSPDPDNTGKSVETVVEETQESTPKQDNVITDYHHGDKVEYIKRIENITDADAAFNMLAQQFGKTPSDEVKNTYDGFVTTCRGYNGVLSIELDTLRRYERDMYDVLCYFPDLDQTPDIVKVAYDTDKHVLDNSVSVSEGIRLSKLAPFKDTRYKKNEDAFWQRLTKFNSTWSSSSRNCKIPELPSLWKCTKYSAMIRIHDRDGKMYLEMTKWQDRPGGNSDNYFVGK